MDDRPPSLFRKILGLLSLLGAGLYFVGWIYRWSYFGYFHLEVTTLDLAFESFLLVPLQVFFGNAIAIVKAAIALSLTPVAIRLSLAILKSFDAIVVCILKRSRQTILKYLLEQQTSKYRQWRNIARSITGKILPHKPHKIDFSQTILDEAIALLWVLLVLFYLAKSQGTIDARRDAYNTTSTLPVVTFVTPKNLISLGQPFATPQPVDNFRIIGDPKLWEQVENTASLSDSETDRVWRLLIERDRWIYIFRTLKPCSSCDPRERPLVVAIRDSDLGNQLLILSPTTVK